MPTLRIDSSKEARELEPAVDAGARQQRLQGGRFCLLASFGSKVVLQNRSSKFVRKFAVASLAQLASASEAASPILILNIYRGVAQLHSTKTSTGGGGEPHLGAQCAVRCGLLAHGPHCLKGGAIKLRGRLRIP